MSIEDYLQENEILTLEQLESSCFLNSVVNDVLNGDFFQKKSQQIEAEVQTPEDKESTPDEDLQIFSKKRVKRTKLNSL
jgi:hypothetical protein